MKVIRKPMTDIYSRDFTTGKVVYFGPIEQELDKEKKVQEFLHRKIEEAKAKGITDWKIHIEGLWRVQA